MSGGGPAPSRRRVVLAEALLLGALALGAWALFGVVLPGVAGR